MASETSSCDKIRFGVFELAVRSAELCRGGVCLPIHGRPVQVLAILLEHPGQMVSREELRNRLWAADTFVDFDHGLHNAVGRLREVLGDSADRPRFIETLPRRGYRFIAKVDRPTLDIALAAVRATAGQQEAVVQQGFPSALQPGSLRTFTLSILAVLSVLTLFYVSNVGRWRERLPGQAIPGPIQSLAVLPLENLSHDAEQDYLADGMTEELITALSKIRALRVISRTSVMRFKGTRQPLPEIAHELNVDAVVEGSILRSGNRVRITAQLIQAHQDKQLWAETYDRDMWDVLALQTDVAGAVAKQVKAEITPAEAAKLSTTRQIDPQVYQLYLQGLYYSEKGTEESARDSREYFQKVIEKDPGYARAWVGLAHAYIRLEDYARAKEAARKAIALDETIGHSQLAFATWNNDWNWTTAQEEFKRAIELDPNNSLAHHGYGVYLAALRHHDEACTEMQRSLELDPLSPLANTNLGSIYWSSHDFDRAIQQLKKALEIDPNFPDAHLYLGMVYESLKSYHQASAEFEKYRRLGNPPEAEAEIARLYALQGRRAEALQLLDDLKARHKAGNMPSYDIALVYVGLGDKDHAFQWLQNSHAEHAADLLQINDDLRFDVLRPDLRFRDLLRSVNYPE